MKRGDIVIAKLYGGESAERRVLRRYSTRYGDKVVICSEGEWQAAAREDREPEGVGFPAEDICDVAAQEAANR